MKFLIPALLLILLSSTTIYAGAGNTAANFLRFGVGARAAGMGDTFTAVADDVYSIYWNPAGMSFIKNQELGITYSIWFEDIAYRSIFFVYPDTKFGSFGGGLIFLGMPDIQGYSDTPPDDLQHQTTLISASDMAGYLSYSRPLNSFVNIGINVKYINQQLENEKATAVAVDIGLIMVLRDKNMKTGIIVQNRGTKIKFRYTEGDLPADVKFGFSKRYMNGKLLGTGELILPPDKGTELRAGIEYLFLDKVFIRTGYKSVASIGSGISYGIGFKSDLVQFDYSFASYGLLGNIHQTDLTMKFGGTPE
jgi:hypothetical protein